MVTLLAVGDVGPHRDNPDEAFDLVRDILKAGDITFGQQEITFSERGKHDNHFLAGNYGERSRTHPKAAKSVAAAGFDVMSFASNHALNFGDEAFDDTIEHLTSNKVQVIGAGQNIGEARRPAIFKKDGNTVGMLAYCTVVPPGDEATETRSGLAPVRAFAHFIEDTPWQPGRQPKVVTMANQEDLLAMQADIHKLRPTVDVLFVSLHMGATGVPPATIADYQYALAHAAVDAGADIVVGHHPHVLKGVEVYKGKPIFYCIGNFVMDESVGQLLTTLTYKLRPFEFDPEYPTYPYPAEYRKSMIVKCTIENKKVTKVSFLPLLINKKGQPEPLKAGDPRSDDVLEFVRAAGKDQGITTTLVRSGDEIEVVTS